MTCIEAQANDTILDARRQYHYRNKASQINLNITNHMQPVITFSDELKPFYRKKTIPAKIIEKWRTLEGRFSSTTKDME